MSEAGREWVSQVGRKTVLAHPKVRAQVDQGVWVEEAYRLFRRSIMWSLVAASVLWVAAVVVFVTAEGDRFEAVTPWGLAAFFGSPVVFKVVGPLVRRWYLRKIDAGFAKNGWDVKVLRAEVREKRASARRAARDRDRARTRAARQQTDKRLYPPR